MKHTLFTQTQPYLAGLASFFETDQNKAFFTKIAPWLPESPVTYFELHNAKTTLDMIIVYLRSEQNWNSDLLTDYRKRFTTQKWEQVLALTDQWYTDENFEAVNALSWEFDFTENIQIEAPSLHYAVHDTDVQEFEQIIRQISTHFEITDSQREKMITIFNSALKLECDMHYISLMLSRGTKSEIRCILSLDFDDLKRALGEYFPECQFKSFSDLIADIKPDCETFLNIIIPVNSESSEFGLEFYPLDNKWEQILDCLRNHDLNPTDQLHNRFNNWLAPISANQRKEPARGFNHLKLSYRQNALTDLKLYATIEHEPD